jgi:hypothetical protein
MRPLYIDGLAGCRVVLDDPALRVIVPDKADQLFPLSRVSRVVCKGIVEWSMSAMLACADAGINLIFLHKNGEVRARWLATATKRQSITQRLIDLLSRSDGVQRYENWYLSMQKLAARSFARKQGVNDWREVPVKTLQDLVNVSLTQQGQYRAKLLLGILHSELLVMLIESGFSSDDESLISNELNLAADFSQLLLWYFYPFLLIAENNNNEKDFAIMAALYQEHEDQCYLLMRTISSKLQQFLLAMS